MGTCNICPRNCGVDRENGQLGACHSPDDLLISKIMLHKWEEPCLVGDGGAGTVFFSGCNLGCVFCQNRRISRGDCGEIMSEGELQREIFKLEDMGASCIEFVTPTHYTQKLISLLERIKLRLSVPTVWNSGGYEKPETLGMLDGLIDIYMPDFKYFSPEIAKKYSGAEDYAKYALASLSEMARQVGAPLFKNDGSGILQSGVIVRHLILPSHRADSIAVLELIAKEVGAQNVLLSLMGQYTPDFYVEYVQEMDKDTQYKNLCRKITSFEYDSVISVAQRLNFDGYFQSLDSAVRDYTPDF